MAGLAVRAAGRLQQLRDRSLSYGEKWTRRKGQEAGYWHDALKAPEARRRFADRLDPEAPLDDELLERVIGELGEVSSISILDVGSGPLTSVGKKLPGVELEVTACDALADEYLDTMAEVGITPPAPPVNCAGEELESTFGADSFDLVFMTNALDHTADPLLILRNMLTVARSRGAVVLRHMECEGERNEYFGIHLWNIEHRNGSFLVWNRSTRVDVADYLGSAYRVDCWVDDQERVNSVIRSAT